MEYSIRDQGENLSPAFLLTQLQYSEHEAESMIFLAVEEHHFHVGTRLVTAKAKVTNIIRLEQTFPQVRGGWPGRAVGGGGGAAVPGEKRDL